MAQRIANKFPVDTKPSVALGLSLPFNGSAVFNSNYSTQDQIKSNLINFFLTNHGERPMNPNFGANLRADLFEALNTKTLDILEQKIKNLIQINFPSVRVRQLRVLQSQQTSTINVEITYSVVPFGINDQINLTFN